MVDLMLLQILGTHFSDPLMLGLYFFTNRNNQNFERYIEAQYTNIVKHQHIEKVNFVNIIYNNNTQIYLDKLYKFQVTKEDRENFVGGITFVIELITNSLKFIKKSKHG